MTRRESLQMESALKPVRYNCGLMLAARGFVNYSNAYTPTAASYASRTMMMSGVIIAVFVFWTHRANIGRLRRGEEHRFVKKETAA